MHIIAKCPRCGYRWWLDAIAADRRIRCRKCFMLLRVPDLAKVHDAANIINQANSDIYVDEAGKLFG